MKLDIARYALERLNTYILDYYILDKSEEEVENAKELTWIICGFKGTVITERCIRQNACTITRKKPIEGLSINQFIREISSKYDLLEADMSTTRDKMEEVLLDIIHHQWTILVLPEDKVTKMTTSLQNDCYFGLKDHTVMVWHLQRKEEEKHEHIDRC